MRWSSSALPKLLSYSLKSFPVKYWSDDRTYPLSSTLWHPTGVWDTIRPPVCHVLIGHITHSSDVIGRKMFTLRYVEAGRGPHRCCAWPQWILPSNSTNSLASQMSVINIFTLLSQHNLVTCELKWGGSFTESNILIHVDRQRSNVYSLNSFILPIFI